MSSLDELAQNLARPEVTELAIMAGRPACVRVKGAYAPISEEAVGTGALVRLLAAAGGSKHMAALGETPTQWPWRVPGLGVVGVVVQVKDNIMRARFALVQREGAAAAADAQGAAAPAPVGGDVARAARPAAAPGPAPSPAATPPAPARGKAPARAPVAPPPPAPDPLDVGGTPEIPFGAENSASWEVPLPAIGAPASPVPRETTPPPARDAAPAPARPTRAPAPAPARAPAGPTTAPAAPAAKGGAATTATASAAATAGAAAAAAAAALPARSLDASALDELIEDARGIAASNLHLIADRPPLVRLAGELVPRGARVDAASVERIARAIIPPRLMATFEADGSCDFSMDGKRTGRLRVNASRQRTGVKICLRLIPKDVPTLASLGLPDSIAKATHHHQGLIVITGPTGHGKTSTLAALVDLINSETTHHVITVEDPVEYIHGRKKAMISQREVGTHTKSFAAALKGSLREDPDVIVVGELRDTETVRMALAASETGHLLIGTMNTPSAAKTIDRLIDLFPPADQAQVRTTLAGGLRLVVGQRLLPDASGKGLCAAAEILPGSMALWSLIRDNRTFQIPSLQQRGKSLGITRLDESLAELVRAGRTTLEAASVYAEAPDELAAMVAGAAPGGTP